MLQAIAHTFRNKVSFVYIVFCSRMDDTYRKRDLVRVA